jgi:hypothetical protein
MEQRAKGIGIFDCRLTIVFHRRARKVRRGKTLFVVKEKDYLTQRRGGRREQIYLCKKHIWT